MAHHLENMFGSLFQASKGRKFKMTVSDKGSYTTSKSLNISLVPKYKLYGYGLCFREFSHPSKSHCKVANTWNFWLPGWLLSISTSRILSIVFNPNGTRCVTTDNNGVVGVWKTDQRGLCNQSLWQKQNMEGRGRQNTAPKTNSLPLKKWRLGKLLSSLGRSIFKSELLVLGSVKVGRLIQFFLLYLLSQSIIHRMGNIPNLLPVKLKNLFIYESRAQKMNFQLFNGVSRFP